MRGFDGQAALGLFLLVMWVIGCALGSIRWTVSVLALGGLSATSVAVHAWIYAPRASDPVIFPPIATSVAIGALGLFAGWLGRWIAGKIRSRAG